MVQNNYLYSKFAKNELGDSRIILVVPSKTVKKAVLRNKLRRRTREILRKDSINIRKGYDLVFIFQKGAENLDFETLEKEINKELSAKRLKK